ncbi:hypothetical protein FLJC2902T_22500 [Flavobacterium limnosediminis JC2902]|uniref:Uncharacterized protein n=1 Tax=Flavobacterium limnosediminis JC2902 TaxID=1341181 RepID=V6SLD3_9FLAO|nr:hypothetical protein FLJC2902T_22500 [Flavobacterium limnosediminis JC2902]
MSALKQKGIALNYSFFVQEAVVFSALFAVINKSNYRNLLLGIQRPVITVNT